MTTQSTTSRFVKHSEYQMLAFVTALDSSIGTILDGGHTADIWEPLNELKRAGEACLRRLTGSIPLVASKKIIQMTCLEELEQQDMLKLRLSEICRLFSEAVAYQSVHQGRPVRKKTREEIVHSLKVCRQQTPRELTQTRFNLKCAKAAWQSMEGGAQLARGFVLRAWYPLSEGGAKIAQLATTSSSALSLPTMLIRPLINAIKRSHSMKRKGWFPHAFTLHRRSLLILRERRKRSELFKDFKGGYVSIKDHSVAFAAVEALETLFWHKPDEENLAGFKHFVQFTESDPTRKEKKELGWKVRYRTAQALVRFYCADQRSGITKEKKQLAFQLLRNRLFKRGDKKEIQIVEENPRVRMLLLNFYLTTETNPKWAVKRFHLLIALTKKEKKRWGEVSKKLSNVQLARKEKARLLENLRRQQSATVDDEKALATRKGLEQLKVEEEELEAEVMGCSEISDHLEKLQQQSRKS